jgi:hypothetical protein
VVLGCMVVGATNQGGFDDLHPSNHVRSVVDGHGHLRSACHAKWPVSRRARQLLCALVSGPIRSAAVSYTSPRVGPGHLLRLGLLLQQSSHVCGGWCLPVRPMEATYGQHDVAHHPDTSTLGFWWRLVWPRTLVLNKCACFGGSLSFDRGRRSCSGSRP